MVFLCSTASVHAAASPIGSLTAGVTIEQWGRRKIAFMGNIGLALGWLIIAGAQNSTMLILGRIIEGLSKSMVATSLTVSKRSTFTTLFV